MKLGLIALRLRAAGTSLGENYAGAAELSFAQRGTINKEVAFVIPLEEEADPNKYDSEINQKIFERFGIVVALPTDSVQSDKLGINAYDRLHDIRSEIFRAIMGIDLQEADSKIYYRGARLLDITRANIWYQYEFEDRAVAISGVTTNIDGTPGDGAPGDGVVDIQMTLWQDRQQESQLASFDTLYNQWVLSPSPKAEAALREAIVEQGGLPVSTGLIDMTTIVDFTDNPDAGAYYKGFGSGFDRYNIKVPGAK